MTIGVDIERLVTRLSPAPVCDTCIAERLALAPDMDVHRATGELVGAHGFERRKDACSLCGTITSVICRR